MKKFSKIFIALVACVIAIFGICKISSADTIYSAPIENGIIEYNIPNVTSGAMHLSHAHTIFKLLPYEVKEKSVLAFRDIIRHSEKTFVYGGVTVKHPSDSTWEFNYNNASIVVRNTSLAELSTFFQMPETI